MRDLPAVAMEWHHGLFAHWPVAPERVRPLVPDALDVDVREGMAWVSALPSVVSAMRPAFAPSGVGLTYPQVNFRTYVRHDDRPGVYFLSLDAESRLGVRVARAAYGLPYYRADVDVERERPGGTVERLDQSRFSTAGEGVRWKRADPAERTPGTGGATTPDGSTKGDGGTTTGEATTTDGSTLDDGSARPHPTYRFESVRWHTEDPQARFAAAYRPTDWSATADGDSLDAFLAERYRAYVVRDGRVWCARVEHEPWPLAPAEATVQADSLFEAVGLPAPADEPVARYSPGVEITIRTPFRT